MRFRSVALEVLGHVATLLRSKHPSALDEADFAALTSSLSTRKNALAVFRQVALGRSRRVQIMNSSGLQDEQVQRVLRWGLANGLVAFSPAGDESHYHLTRLGELALQAIDEPAWLPVATHLVRAATRFRVAGAHMSGLAADALERIGRATGLALEAVKLSLDVIGRAVDPALASGLASALSVVAGTRKGVLLFARAPEDREVSAGELGDGVVSGEPTVLLMRMFERTGLFSLQVEEPPVQAYVTNTEGCSKLSLPLDRPIVSFSLKSAITRAISLAYGDVVRLEQGTLLIRSKGPQRGPVQHYTTSGGIVARIYDDVHGTTHLIIGGIDRAGRGAACRFFYEHFDELISSRSEESFAVLVPQHASSKSDVRVIPLHTSSPEALTAFLEWREPSDAGLQHGEHAPIHFVPDRRLVERAPELSGV
ncbi:MAG TPA: hypothetical protein VF263_07090 [Longimicrobiaceae bacterium]